MPTVLIIIGLVVLAVIAVVALLVKLKPNQYRVTRRAVVGASPNVVFDYINDLHKWEQWSPWDKRDPNLKRTYSGALAGVGAIYDWEGNKDVGSGQMTIVDTKPVEHLDIKLEFFKPFAGVNQVSFVLKPVSAGTDVTWNMDCTYVLMTKIISLFMDFDKMIGKDFAQGLANLDEVVRTSAVS